MAQPVITVQPTNQFIVAGNTATFGVSVSGAGPFAYQWQFNGINFPNSIITTEAGNGSDSFSGDGGVATNAGLDSYAVAVDGGGNVYIADAFNNRIRKVSTNGIITTVAGNGTWAFSGDGGAATNAGINPYGVTIDVDGNLFVSDLDHHLIRKSNTNGIITTVAGNGSYSYSRDGGAATNAALDSSCTAVDTSGNLFIADYYNNRIRKVSTNGIITTVAGNGTWAFSGDGGAAIDAELKDPSAVAMDTQGNLFIADTYNHRIRKIDTNHIITTVAGNGINSFSGDGGAATNAALNYPSGVVLDAGGNLLIADRINSRIRKVNTNGIITTVAGNGPRSFSGDGGVAI